MDNKKIFLCDKCKEIYEDIYKYIQIMNNKLNTIKGELFIENNIIIIIFISKVITYKFIYDFNLNKISYIDINTNRILNEIELDINLMNELNFKRIFNEFIFLYAKENIKKLKKEDIISKNIIKTKIINDLMPLYSKLFDCKYNKNLEMLINYAIETET